jgi:hypothetical protein
VSIRLESIKLRSEGVFHATGLLDGHYERNSQA